MTGGPYIPVAAPAFCGNEKRYANDCLDSMWISSVGKYIPAFEAAFASFCGVKHAIAVCNGTVAMHLAMLALGIGPGDEVIVPTFTYVATANCVTYVGATPVLVDSEPRTWNIDPARVEQAITPRTKAIIAVHIYGHPADMTPLLAMTSQHRLHVIEDAAEAHGAKYHGRLAGSLGEIAAFSFFGNKIITCGEGGMVTTNDDKLAATIRQLKGQGVDPARRYWFTMVGYNYRMTNIEAAIGLAQLEEVEWHLAQRRRVYHTYRKHLDGHDGITLQPEMPECVNSYWMTSVLLGDGLPERNLVMQRLADAGIETRPFFPPMHTLPIYKNLAAGKAFPVADRISTRGMNLPSFGNLTAEEIAYVCTQLLQAVHQR